LNRAERATSLPYFHKYRMTKILLEGIQHLEDMDLRDFVRAVANIAKMQATEKLDGAQLWFGLDDSGRLYTSRAGKSKEAENTYNESDYPYLSASNGFRATHAALKAKEDEINKILRPGDTVEIEVLFGRQPNAVTYGAGGKNYIAFLRGVEGTSDIVVDQLANSLHNHNVTVNVKLVDTTDGENLQLNKTDVAFQFVGVQKVDTSKLKDTNITKQLAALEKFLKTQAGLEGSKISNFDLITGTLGSFDKNIRPKAKELKNTVMAQVMADFKLPIKRELLDKFVSQIKSPLAASDLSSEEDVGIEGVVLKDPESGEQIKLVDKDTFTTINQFNYSVRSALSGIIKTTNPEASLESRGGILGELKITIADLLGNIDLARPASAKKIFATVKGKTPQETVKNMAKQLHGGHDYLGTKNKINALIDNTRQKVAQELKDFKNNKDKFQLKLKSGKTMGLSTEIIRRTLLSFAETKRDLDELSEKLQKTKNLPQLVALLYGKIVKAVHQDGGDAVVSESTSDRVYTIEESLLLEKRPDTDSGQYGRKDAWTILNIYFATYMMAAIIYKLDDRPGIRLLRDKSHMRLQRWDREMSAINFWGYPVWRSGTPAVKKLIGARVAAEIFKSARKVPPGYWKFLHMDLSYGRDKPIDWVEHRKALTILQHTPGMYSDRINTLLDSTFRYDTLTFDEKVKYQTKLFYYIQQFIPTSPLAHRLRVIHDQLLLNANGQNDQMVQEMKLIKQVSAITEDDVGAAGGGDSGVSAGNVATSGVATSAESVANYPQRIFGDKYVVTRRRRNPNITKAKFPRPKIGKKS